MGVVFIAKTTCFGPYHGPSSGQTWWWPSARAETCCISNKYSTNLL